MIPLFVPFLQVADPYAALASAIPAGEWKAVESFAEGSGPVPSFLPTGTTPLSAQKAASQRWDAVLSGLRQATELPYRPGQTEPSQIMMLSKLATFAARTKFAEGERHGAVTLLLDGLTMVRRTRSALGETVILRSFAQNLDGVPLAECDRVCRSVNAFLTFPSETDTGLRLLRAHMRIEAFRWQWLKLPGSLKDAMPFAQALDGARGRPFHFEQTEGGYVLKTEPGKDGMSYTLSGPIPPDAERS